MYLVCSRYIYACSLAWSAATSPMTALLKLTHRNNSIIKKIAGSAAFTLHARRLICSSLRGVSACACGFVYLNAAAVRVLRVHIRFFFLKFIFLERKKILFFRSGTSPSPAPHSPPALRVCSRTFWSAAPQSESLLATSNLPAADQKICRWQNFYLTLADGKRFICRRQTKNLQSASAPLAIGKIHV